jgi:competence ComEA-like helix-hairpin-helix protein
VNSYPCHSERSRAESKKEKSLACLFLRLVAFVAILALPCSSAEARHKWVTFENCTLILNKSNDGDSFHVRVKRKEYIFRLYFVDTPETDNSVPERVDEQAKYFGVAIAQALQVGEVAKSFTANKLSKPFTVRTCMEDALGRSSRQRFYAMVQCQGQDLAEELVENGLARVHGASAGVARELVTEEEWIKLGRLEVEAKREKVGGWGVNFGRTNVRSEKEGGKPYDSFGAFFHEAKPASVPESESLGAGTGPGGGKSAPGTLMLDINSASIDELQKVPGIGPAMAARIAAGRPFQSADDLRQVKGIGDATYAKIRAYFK